MKKDYYEILNVAKDADEKTVKQSYRRIAMELHPDRNPGNPEAEEAFKEAAEAYSVLSNPEKREMYDRYGHDGLSGGAGFSGVEDIFSHFGDIFSEFFGGDIFGGGRRSTRPPRPPRGSDLRYDLRITFEEAMTGVRKQVEITQLRNCEECDGSGSEPGAELQTCSTCQGRGQVVQRTGFMTLASMCPACSGRGTLIASPCGNCNGRGMAPFSRTVTAKVPAGVDTGMRLRLAGEGEHTEDGGEPGDLYVFIEVEPHDDLVRDGNELIAKVYVSYLGAILGRTVEVAVVGEVVEVELPNGTQPGDRIRVPGKGVPYVGRKSRGDLVVEVTVTVPETLSDKERELIEELDAIASEE